MAAAVFFLFKCSHIRFQAADTGNVSVNIYPACYCFFSSVCIKEDQCFFSGQCVGVWICIRTDPKEDPKFDIVQIIFSLIIRKDLIESTVCCEQFFVFF